MKSNNDTIAASRFIFFGLGFIYFGWFAYLFAVSDFFYRSLLAGIAILLGLGIIIALWKFLRYAPRDVWIASAIAVGIAFFIGYVSEPTLYSGRDQGAIAEAAIELGRNGALSFHSESASAFFPLYGPGRALNFPGFFYTIEGKLVTQFPLGSIAWFGAFHSLFGLPGFAIGNGFTLVIGLLSIFFLIRIFAGPIYALLGLGLAAFSFLPTWFAKYTLSENLAFFLFSFTALNLVLFIKDRGKTSYLNILLGSTLLSFTRIEGFAILPLALAILFFSKQGREYVKEHPFRRRTFPLLAITAAIFINFSISFPFLRTIGKAVYENLTTFSDGGSTSFPSELGSLWSILFLYGLAPIFLLGILGATYLARRRQWFLLLPVFPALPTFFYLFSPNITPDHPWMLRRFLPTIFPGLLISGIISIALFFHKKKESETIDFPQSVRGRVAVSVLFFILFATSFFTFIRYSGFAENRELAEVSRNLANSLGDRDLLLIDRAVTSDPYAIPAGPIRFLYGKNAAYAFNPQDIPKLPQEQFDHIYLLAPIESFAHWQPVLKNNSTFVRPINISVTRLETLNASTLRLPEKVTITTNNILWKIK